LTQKTSKTFLSYSRVDSAFVLRLGRHLVRSGVDVWLDQLELQPGVMWDNEIELALASASKVIVVLSPDSCRSQHVRDEIGYALDHGKTVIPLMYRTCESPLRLHRQQWVDFRGSYSHAFESLLRDLKIGAEGEGLPEEQSATGSTQQNKTKRNAAGALISRRTFAVGAAATGCGLVAAGVFERTRIVDWLHPLPAKRFVVVAEWPASAGGPLQTLVSSVMDAIGTELARAEASDHNLLVLPAQAGAALQNMADLNMLRQSMGANLVLGIAATAESAATRLQFQVIDPAQSKVLRESSMRIEGEDQMQTPAQAAKTAASLLNVEESALNAQPATTGTSNKDAYAAFQAAEAAKNEANDTQLETAIDFYKKAIDLDPNYAQAYARLAWAYLRTYGLTHKGAALDLARDNAQAALQLDPNSVDAHVALSTVYQKQGDDNGAATEIATALQLDPTDPHTLTYQAELLRNQCKWAESEAAFQRLVQLRPNYWLARYEYGVMLWRSGRYEEALKACGEAALAYPGSALPLEAIGNACTQLGRWQEAADALTRSNALKSYDGITASFAELYRMQQKWDQAIAYAERAVQQDSDSPDDLAQLGIVYASAGKPRAKVLDAYQRAGTAQELEMADRPADGPGWMLLALCRAETGQMDEAKKLVKKAEDLYALDVDSQLIKLRVLELVRDRQDSLQTLAQCLKRAPVKLQVEAMPELAELRVTPEYHEIISRA